MDVSKTTINDKYVATVHTPKDLDYYPIIKITVGSTVRHCVQFEIYRNSNSAYLSGFGYNKKCRIDESLERGYGTIDLLKCSIAYIFQKYSNIDFIEFKDTSTIQCNNGERMELWLFSIATSKKTWYEKHLNAKLIDKKERNAYKIMKTKLSSKLEVKDRKYVPHSLKTIFDSAIEKDKTYQQFFRLVTDEYPDCEIFTKEKWLFQVLPPFDFMHAEWRIKRNHFDLSIIEKTNQMQHGGFKDFPRTLKRKLDTDFANLQIIKNA